MSATITLDAEFPVGPQVECVRARASRTRPLRHAPSAFEDGGHTADDDALVARLRAGDDAAYESLVRVHGPRMLAVARGYLSSKEDAEDVLQSAFVLVFRFIHRFEGASRLSTWLHKIVVNCALMRIRSRKRHAEGRQSDSATEGPVDAEFAEHAYSSVMRELSVREEHARLLGAIGRLPESVRAAVRLRIVDGLSLAETSLLMGQSTDAVRASVRRGRSALRSLRAPDGKSLVGLSPRVRSLARATSPPPSGRAAARVRRPRHAVAATQSADRSPGR